MASVALVPRAEQDIRAALNVLALNFSLNDKVVEELLKVGVRNLEEFRFLFEDEAKVGAFVAKIGLGDEATIQTARLRRAWTATRVYFSQVEQDRSKVALADLDSLLEESELRDAKQAFWRRYRLRFPAEVHPSDAVVSRVSRELSKRMLCLFNVWKVRSLQFQLGTSQKKRRLGDGLFTEEAETEESYTADCDTYLNKLHTLLIAYSLAGCQPIPGVADAAKEQTLGADSTEYVEVPLDTMLQYFYRAKWAVSGMPVNKRLAWLQARDSDERSEWVTKFREGTRSLGAVVKELMASRDAHWLPHVVSDNQSVAAPVVTPNPAGAAPKPASESKFLPGPVINGRPTAKQMKDGLRLCEGFNKGTCSNKNCGNGAHRCSVILRAERVCGSPAHPAAKCKAKAKH